MRRQYLAVALLIALACTPAARAQAPVIASLQNAASRVTLTALSPQMLFTITGRNLATSTEVASYPLPTTLGGATVIIQDANFFPGGVANSAPIPLLYASPTQINAQAPSWLEDVLVAGDTNSMTVGITVTTAHGSSHTVSVNLQPVGAGIFAQGSTGCGQAVAFNIPSGGGPLSLNTTQNSFDPDKDLGLAIMLTGAGYFADRVDGAPWQFNPADNEAPPVATDNGPSGPLEVIFGAPNSTALQYGLYTEYVGPAIGYAGIDQVNGIANWTGLQWTVPAQGCHVPMYLELPNNSASQIVDVSIHSGGGACADSPAGMLGIVQLQSHTMSGTSGMSSSAAVTAQFLQSAGLGFPAPGPLGAQLPVATAYDFPPQVGPLPAVCAAVVPTFDAGILTISGPGLASLTLTPETQNGQISYQASVPASALAGGAYQVMGSGGSQVGPWQANGQIPAPIKVTSNLAPGINLPGATDSSDDSYTFTWTGGDAQSMVTMEFIVVNSEYTQVPFHVAVTAPATAHQITIADFSIGEGFGPPVFFQIPHGSVELIFTQSPVTAPSLPFSAGGLGMGGELTWSYVFDYQGLTNNPTP